MKRLLTSLLQAEGLQLWPSIPYSYSLALQGTG